MLGRFESTEPDIASMINPKASDLVDGTDKHAVHTGVTSVTPLRWADLSRRPKLKLVIGPLSLPDWCRTQLRGWRTRKAFGSFRAAASAADRSNEV
jgi:hypothetical protein